MIYFIPNRFIFIHESNTVRKTAPTAGISRTAIPIKAMNHIVPNLFFFKFSINNLFMFSRKRSIPFTVLIKRSIIVSMFLLKIFHIFVNFSVYFIHHISVSLFLFLALFQKSSGIRILNRRRSIKTIIEKLSCFSLTSAGQTEKNKQYTYKYNSHAKYGTLTSS